MLIYTRRSFQNCNLFLCPNMKRSFDRGDEDPPLEFGEGPDEEPAPAPRAGAGDVEENVLPAFEAMLRIPYGEGYKAAFEILVRSDLMTVYRLSSVVRNSAIRTFFNDYLADQGGVWKALFRRWFEPQRSRRMEDSAEHVVERIVKMYLGARHQVNWRWMILAVHATLRLTGKKRPRGIVPQEYRSIDIQLPRDMRFMYFGVLTNQISLHLVTLGTGVQSYTLDPTVGRGVLVQIWKQHVTRHRSIPFNMRHETEWNENVQLYIERHGTVFPIVTTVSDSFFIGLFYHLLSMGCALKLGTIWVGHNEPDINEWAFAYTLYEAIDTAINPNGTMLLKQTGLRETIFAVPVYKPHEKFSVQNLYLGYNVKRLEWISDRMILTAMNYVMILDGPLTEQVRLSGMVRLELPRGNMVRVNPSRTLFALGNVFMKQGDYDNTIVFYSPDNITLDEIIPVSYRLEIPDMLNFANFWFLTDTTVLTTHDATARIMPDRDEEQEPSFVSVWDVTTGDLLHQHRIPNYSSFSILAPVGTDMYLVSTRIKYNRILSVHRVTHGGTEAVLVNLGENDYLMGTGRNQDGSRLIIAWTVSKEYNDEGVNQDIVIVMYDTTDRAFRRVWQTRFRGDYSWTIGMDRRFAASNIHFSDNDDVFVIQLSGRAKVFVRGKGMVQDLPMRAEIASNCTRAVTRVQLDNPWNYGQE